MQILAVLSDDNDRTIGLYLAVARDSQLQSIWSRDVRVDCGALQKRQ